jgi:peptide/nickel transport system substrate-binding protein
VKTGRLFLIGGLAAAAVVVVAVAALVFGRGGSDRAVSSHRGGTLRVEFSTGYSYAGYLDPSLAGGTDVASVLSLTNDGLVAFGRSGGTGGMRLVPDLAESLPMPTDGGRTYSFRLRKGIRYSNGTTVKASDVLATFDRLFALASGPTRFENIVGGRECEIGHPLCFYSRGITVDDGARTVTFHLTKPDPEFLYALAMPYAFVLPGGTPGPNDRAGAVPATGPYEIAVETPTSAKTVRLIRNRRFKVWSGDAKPDGYPEEIDVHWADPPAAQTDLARGRIDVAPDQTAAVATQHRDGLHETPQAGTVFWRLDTRQRPFDDIRARRAVSYAVDRAQAARAAPALTRMASARPTCQVLPPNLPEYRANCPFTLHPTSAGTWSAPDLAKARKLVRASGTEGAEVRVEAFTREVRRLARSTLEPLGYRVSFFAPNPLFEPAVRPRKAIDPEKFKDPQITLTLSGTVGTTIEGFPSPATSFSPLACMPYAGACSKPLDRQIRRTLALQGRDRAAASKAWADVDRRATNLAMFVPLLTPVSLDVVSKRVGNFQRHAVYGVLFDQLWVK